jgi:ribosomal protein S21
VFSAEVNTNDFARALRALERRVRAATRRAEVKAAHTVERETKKTLNRYAHPAGTKTPSPPGQPPAKVTGTLGRSMQVGVLREVRPGVLTIDVGPTAVQARIQELGWRFASTGRSSR